MKSGTYRAFCQGLRHFLRGHSLQFVNRPKFKFAVKMSKHHIEKCSIHTTFHFFTDPSDCTSYKVQKQSFVFKKYKISLRPSLTIYKLHLKRLLKFIYKDTKSYIKRLIAQNWKKLWLLSLYIFILTNFGGDEIISLFCV